MESSLPESKTFWIFSEILRTLPPFYTKATTENEALLKMLRYLNLSPLKEVQSERDRKTGRKPLTMKELKYLGYGGFTAFEEGPDGWYHDGIKVLEKGTPNEINWI